MQFKRIVVGIDFSANSLAAASWVAHHFSSDAELVLVHVVVESDVPSLRRCMPRMLDEIRVVRPQQQGGLRGLGELLGASRTRTEILSGDPAEVLALVAAQVGADLTCVGSGSRRKGSARFGATTPHRLIARTEIPVLVAARVPSGTLNRILVPFDDRPSGKTALKTASRLSTAHEAELDALYVIEPGTYSLASRRNGETNDNSFMNAERWAAALVDEIELPSGRAASYVRSGDAGEQTVSQARRSDSDLIVMGTGERNSTLHGDNCPRHVGSTTRFVIWAAPCPVLVVPQGEAAITERLQPARGSGMSLVQLGSSDSLAAV